MKFITTQTYDIPKAYYLLYQRKTKINEGFTPGLLSFLDHLAAIDAETLKQNFNASDTCSLVHQKNVTLSKINDYCEVNCQFCHKLFKVRSTCLKSHGPYDIIMYCPYCGKKNEQYV